VETIGSKRSYALIWCMPNNDDDDSCGVLVYICLLFEHFCAVQLFWRCFGFCGSKNHCLTEVQR